MNDCLAGVGVCRPTRIRRRVPRIAKTPSARGYVFSLVFPLIPRRAPCLGSAISVEFAVRVMSGARTAFLTLGAFDL
jgi:hypothetical protein